MTYQLKKIRLDLKVNWKISRNQSLYKENYILIRDGHESEVAPNIRYGETPSRIEQEFQELVKQGKENPGWSNSFLNAYRNLELKVKTNGLFARELGLPESGKVRTSFSIPMMELSEVEKYLKEHSGYEVYKLKISGEKDFELLQEVASYTSSPIRIDANEGFSTLSEYLSFEERIKGMNIEFVEQPFPAQNISDYIELKKKSRFEIIADESVEKDFDVELFRQKFDGINIKLMKAGGIENALFLINKAKQAGLKTMIGCMIETSLGISEALPLAAICDYCDLDGALLIKNDPYQKLINYNDSELSW